MKVAIILILFKTAPKELTRLKKQFASIFPACKFYVTDNTHTHAGFASGVNRGLEKALKDDMDIFIIANPDIALPKICQVEYLKGLSEFDILGFAMKQRGQVYYGGKIDPWYLSGGLITRKPATRFSSVDFVVGSLMIVKKQVVKNIGLFDEKYFMYYEDVDYCLQAQRSGFKIGIDRDIVYEHFEVSINNPDKKTQLARSHKLFFERYGNYPQKIRLKIRSLLKGS